LTHEPTRRLRVCAVGYLNTVPLVWGMLRGPQQGLFDLDFQPPSECADRMASGAADIGIVPAIELARQDLDILRGTGIACRGAVRSILLISRCAPDRIRTLAADTSSRTSIQLARIVLSQRFGAEPELVPHPPRLEGMLAAADASIIIGDPALHIDPATLPYRVYDLGAEWMEMTGLPMVFAVWAARKGVVCPAIERAFIESWRFGRDRIPEIVAAEAPVRGLAPELAMDYLTHRIMFELGDREYAGMNEFLRRAAALPDPVAYNRS
jgi:predicted solute-binding protein